MKRTELIENIKRKKSFLCVGLDSELSKIPQHLLKFEDPIFEFNKEIIDATQQFAISFKPNLAFYESLGVKGILSLEKTVDYIKKNYPDIFLIADAKRGDIGNTSKMYAEAFFKNMNFDAVTVAPYMGSDSVTPFLKFENKWVILLALTSNDGAFDFQYIQTPSNEKIFETVIKTSQTWADENKMMYVVGATKANMLADIRKIIPNHFLLVPGVGAQGGSLAEVAKYGMNKDCGLIVNSSRAIIFADSSENFANVAHEKAKEVQLEMEKLLINHNIIS
ncbi:MAG: orotidine 5'-phosphate decarboxylase [Bacteroidetes bacterium GWA2_31_9]|nr:MAG: orotidine 5'-phosphate decarboxylase [Bacteroidetes bacterium GWA2_31_9]